VEIRAENGIGFKGADMKALILAAVTLVATAGLATAQDSEAGEKSFRKCLPCHSVGAGARHKIGPVLNGLEGRKSGTIEGYNYSEANKKAAIVWGEASFKDYIVAPMAKVPGTKMAFPGIKNEKEIADLWAYLKQFKADGAKK
jgi:cytochrome c